MKALIGESIARIIDMTLRFLSIVAKVVLVFIAARELATDQFGIFITIQATISLYQYLAGGDISLISHRFFLLGRLSLADLIVTQLPLQILTIILASIAMVENFSASRNSYLIIMVVGVLIFETITTEGQRLLVSMGKFTTANLALFIKSTGWIIPLMAYWGWKGGEVFSLLEFWLCGLVIAALFIVITIFLSGDIWREAKFNKELASEIVRKAIWILMGTLALRALFSLDRLIVEKYGGLDAVGGYGFFLGIAAAYLAILDAGVLTRIYPNIVRAVSDGDNETIYYNIKLSIITSIVFCVISLLLYSYFIDYLLIIVNKNSYINLKYIGYISILSYSFYACSLGYYYVIYGMKKDKTILFINFICTIPLLIIIIINKYDVRYVVGSVFFGSLLHLILKIYFYSKLRAKIHD